MRKGIMLFVVILLWGCNLLTTPPPDDSLPPVTETNMKLVWEIPYESAGSGINASPLILGDSLVIMSAGKEIFAVEQNTGKIRWKYRESDITCSQTKEYATDGVRIYTTQVEDVRAINISDGSQAWLTPMKNERGAFWTNSMRLNEDKLFVDGNYTTYSLNKHSGTILWSTFLYDYIGDPLYYNNSIIVSGGRNRYDSSKTIIGAIDSIYSLNANNGEKIWSKGVRGDGPLHKMVVDDGIIYGGTYFTWSSGSFEARNATTGELVWSYYTPNEAWSYNDCIVVDDKVIANCRLGNNVYAFNKLTGQLFWRISLPGDPLQEKQNYYNGYVYITQGWKLFVINPDNGQIIYSLKPKGRSLVTIAVGNGKVFVCGHPTLQCYETYKPEK